MISSFAIETIKGIAKKVQYITYSNGRRVKRTYPSYDSIVPETVEVIDERGKTVDSLGFHDRFNSVK